MDKKTFKKTVSELLVDFGFEKRKTSFYKNGVEILYTVGLQKSTYSDSYYFNLGYIFKEIHPSLKYPKYTDGDIRVRFTLVSSGKETDVLHLDDLPPNSIDYVKGFLQKNIAELIEVVEENGIMYLLTKRPTLLYQTTLKAKQYLGIL